MGRPASRMRWVVSTAIHSRRLVTLTAAIRTMYCRNGKTFGLRGCDPVADAAYRDGVLTVEPKGTEPVSESERHGHTFSVFTLWLGANVEMATVVTGTLGIVLFGLSFWQAVLAYAVGTLLGAVALG